RQARGEAVEIGEGLYPGAYLVPIGRALLEQFGDGLAALPDDAAAERIKPIVVEAMMELIKADLARLNIRHDVFFSERTLHGPGGDIERTLAFLREQGL